MSLATRWEQARLRFYRARIRHLVADERWTQALGAVIDFAQWAEGRIEDLQVWLDLTVWATEIVAHLDDPAEYRAFLTHFAEPFLGGRRHPRPELLAAFASIADESEASVMISIGKWLTDARPEWPLGPYMVGHFLEVNSPATELRQQADTIASHYQLAAERAAASQQRRWELHMQLRRGALLLSTGSDRKLGRHLLMELDWTELHPREQIFMAVGLASSSLWTDRLRAMDILLDLHRALDRVLPGYRSVNRRDLRRAAAMIFKLADLHLPEAENRRLEELSTTLFTAEEQWQWKGFVDARRQLSELASAPFDRSADALAQLDTLAGQYRRRWQPVADRLRILRAGYAGSHDGIEKAPAPRRPGDRLPVVDHIAVILSELELRDDTNSSVGEHLDQLCSVLSRDEAADDGGALRPLALVWPKLLNNRSDFDVSTHRDQLVKLAEYHADIAPAPSYGWWPLAAHLYDANLDEVARPIARRALLSGDAVDKKIRFFVATRAFRQAVAERKTRWARRWLEEL